MNYERITDDKQFDGFARDRHEFRYKLAGSYTLSSDVVVDAACGTGYGSKLLDYGQYIGIDKEEVAREMRERNTEYCKADLNTWQPKFDFDVFISIETIEHLADYQHFLKQGRKAKRLMIISTPIEPTKHKNEFHINDFTKEQLDTELQVDGWIILHYEEQDKQYGIWILSK